MSAAVLNAIRQQMRHVQTDSGIIYFCTCSDRFWYYLLLHRCMKCCIIN